MVSYINLRIWIFNLMIFGTTLLPISLGRTLIDSDSDFRVKGVNLGGWLVTEGWIQPSLFDGIPNKDFLDGTSLQFKSMTTQKYLCAESGGGTILVANCTTTTSWENFRLWRMNETTFRFRVFNDQFVGLDGIKVVAVVNTSTDSAMFEIVKESNVSTRVRIKASNGFYLQAKTEELVTADVPEVSGWSDNDTTVFNLTIIPMMNIGEFQLTNGYGPDKALQVMKKHWNTFIVEDDFKFLAVNGLNAVRMPVGWWTTRDPNPPPPFVGGSLQVLDNVFLWAEKYKLKIILDLHAAPGSQNGAGHSGSRDGSVEWGKTNETIQQTLDVIDFFSKRYAKSESFYAVELLNEPRDPDVTLDTLTNFSKAGYEVVRKYSSTAYVIFSTRLSFTVPDMPPPQELVPLARSLRRSVIDVHYYSLYYEIFANMTAQDNINYVDTNRTSQLNHIDPIIGANAPLLYVGEWTAEWEVKNATKEDYSRFAMAQIDVYGRTTFGWTYWTLKNVRNHWSFEWMIKNGYIPLN